MGEFNLTKLKARDVPILRRHIGVVFQDYKLLPRKTVFENVAYAMEVIGEKRRHIKKRVPEVLDLVGLKHKMRSFQVSYQEGSSNVWPLRVRLLTTLNY